LVAIALLVAGCAGSISRLPNLPKDAIAAEARKQQIAQLRKYYGELHRVDSVAFRIRTANAEFCNGWVSAQIGLYAATPRSLPRKYRSYTAEALNLTWTRPTAISVVEGSPAAKAGIVTGDQIIAFNGELIPVSGTAGWMDRWLRHNGTKPVRVDMRRNGIDRTVMATPIMGCAIPIDYVIDDTVNAYTTGDKIVIYSAMVALARTDDQLAALIGHELAHANLGHGKKSQWNAILGMASGAAIDLGILAGGLSSGGAFTKEFGKAGALAFSVEFEREADYVGGYYAARAGYNVAAAAELWRAMGMSHPASIRLATTHPVTPVRVVQMHKVAAEIADKKRRHLPLVPDLRVVQVNSEPPDIGGGHY
jgi:Zn-dependent protease with chaperone function